MPPAVRAAGNGVSSAAVRALRSSPLARSLHVTAGVCGQGWQDRLSPAVCHANVPLSLPSGCPDCPATHMPLPVNHGTLCSSRKPPPTTEAARLPSVSLKPTFLSFSPHSIGHHWIHALPGHLTSPRMSHVTTKMGSLTVSLRPRIAPTVLRAP